MMSLPTDRNLMSIDNGSQEVKLDASVTATASTEEDRLQWILRQRGRAEAKAAALFAPVESSTNAEGKV